ncbi:MBL fold metallo-hydrolase [Candidatus Roizmanbacteria bacterium]|nr:MBL fold metallo-hydrolase [Candidatus Roizmanbacteria bacterium]
MNEPPFSRKTLMIVLFISLSVVAYWSALSLATRRSFIAFCDVGQGDGAYVRIENKIDILIDAGPDRRILECLGRHMPFYDKTIEYVFLSHPQKDHAGGIVEVLRHYQIKNIYLPAIDNKARFFQEIKLQLLKNNVRIFYPDEGDMIDFSGGYIYFLAPNRDFVFSHSLEQPGSQFRLTRDNLNDFSLIFNLKIHNQSILFTGDIGPDRLFQITHAGFGLLHKSLFKADILKVPHHGSKNGLTAAFLKLVDPRVALISVGRHNSYHHPSAEIIALLRSLNIEIKRTDEKGTIVFPL